MGLKEVLAGSAWLDENFPGWEREIDLGTLDLMSCEDCICGQSLRKQAKENHWNSGYDYALDELGNSIAWAENHGFTIINKPGGVNAWRKTEAIWRELIKERFSSGNLSDG